MHRQGAAPARASLDNFFAQWVEGTGVPEFTVDYQIIRTRAGKFRTAAPSTELRGVAHAGGIDAAR